MLRIEEYSDHTNADLAMAINWVSATDYLYFSCAASSARFDYRRVILIHVILVRNAWGSLARKAKEWMEIIRG